MNARHFERQTRHGYYLISHQVLRVERAMDRTQILGVTRTVLASSKLVAEVYPSVAAGGSHTTIRLPPPDIQWASEGGCGLPGMRNPAPAGSGHRKAASNCVPLPDPWASAARAVRRSGPLRQPTDQLLVPGYRIQWALVTRRPGRWPKQIQLLASTQPMMHRWSSIQSAHVFRGPADHQPDRI